MHSSTYESESAARRTDSTSEVLREAYLPVQRHLSRAMELFDAEVRSEVGCVQSLVERVSQYRGKLLRPVLLLLTGESCGQVTDAHVILAAVVEMVHVSTLVHDDVLDASALRRSHATINSDQGNTAAVLLGDYLISHSFHLCSGVDGRACRMVGAATNRVCEGELLQIHHRGDLALSEATYLEIVGGKTGALTEVCCELGARYAGADDGIVESMRRFGLAIGIAFQIVDDVLDLVGDRREMGKPSGNDVDNGKATMPTIHCLAHADAATRCQLSAVLTGEVARNDGDVRRWAESTGSIDYAMQSARHHVRRAVDELAILPPSPARRSLETLAELIVQRRV